MEKFMDRRGELVWIASRNSDYRASLIRHVGLTHQGRRIYRFKAGLDAIQCSDLVPGRPHRIVRPNLFDPNLLCSS